MTDELTSYGGDDWKKRRAAYMARKAKARDALDGAPVVRRLRVLDDEEEPLVPTTDKRRETGARKPSSGPWNRRRRLEMHKRYGRRKIDPVEGLEALDGSRHDQTVRRLVAWYGCSRSAAEAFLADATKAGLIERRPIPGNTATGLFKSNKLVRWIDREPTGKGFPLASWRKTVRIGEESF